MATHLISAAAQVRTLAKAVSTAFSASALSDEERMPGAIEITDLPWVSPPLNCRATLGGVPLAEYLNAPVALDEGMLQRFWTKTLEDLWLRPSSVIRRGVFANCGWAMPKVKLGHRAFLFSVPVGFPARLEMTAGAMFSMELAHAASCSLPVLDLVSDDDNYYVELAGGGRIGVKDGLPACESSWSTSVAGMVPDMLEASRGEADYACRFDHLAMIRSVVNVHRKRFPEFQGIDQALQALRVLTLGGHCPDLATQMRMLPLDLPRLREQEHALRESILIVDDLSMSDRSKLQVWHNLLVPAVFSANGFKQHIFSSSQYPFSLAQAKLVAVRTWLESRYRDLPANLQREDVCKL